MAEARQPSGHLRAAVLRALKEANHPVSGLEIRQRIRSEGLAVAPSLVFRELRKLVDRKAIRKIWVARGYMRGSDAPAIALFCKGCGSVVEIACDETFDALDRLAAHQGFSVSRVILELPGVCWACGAHGDLSRDAVDD